MTFKEFMMRNLQEETLEAIKAVGKNIEDIAYCDIYKSDWRNEKDRTICIDNFDINALNLKYDAGYGSQEIFGFIVFTDNSWLQRREYDGSEWWEYFKTPERINKCI